MAVVSLGEGDCVVSLEEGRLMAVVSLGRVDWWLWWG